MDLLKPCEKGIRISIWEKYYVKEYQTKGQPLEEQCTQEVSVIYRIAQAYALSNRNFRPDCIAHHTNTYMEGVTQSALC
jgi:hypothetical protein